MTIADDHIAVISPSATVTVLTGAGISVPSGLAPFRGPGGMWNDIDIETYVSATGFRRDRGKVVGFLRDMLRQTRAAVPNEAHLALARAERARSDGAQFHLITQNIDGLHTRAGSKNVYEIHGSLEVDRCERCGAKYPAESRNACTCSGRLRPDVVLFEESLPSDAMQKAAIALRTCEFFVTIGTSGVVWPAAGFLHEAKSCGARCYNINVEPSGQSAFDQELIGPAEELVAKLFGV